jgi:hypothetical protein
MSAAEQARTILDNVRVLKDKGYTKLVLRILQIKKKQQHYWRITLIQVQNKSHARFRGINQCTVMAEVLKLLAQDARTADTMILKKLFK